MLFFTISNRGQLHRLEHPDGPIEFGRGPERTVKRYVIENPFVSRNHLRVEELPNGLVRVENLSETNIVGLGDGTTMATGSRRDLPTPIRLSIRDAAIDITQEQAETTEHAGTVQTIDPPIQSIEGLASAPALGELGDSPAPALLAQWLERIVALERSAVDLADYYKQTAGALVELVGLDMGLVLLREGDRWRVAASRVMDPNWQIRFSRTLLARVLTEKRSFYQDLDNVEAAMSLADIAAAVVSPVFGLEHEVVGALYGVRSLPTQARRKLGGAPAITSPIRMLEAQVVQLMAAAVGAQLNRAQAMRTRVQFEQFFSPELVRELERDPDLLEGRDQTVTILFSDLRGFTRLSEKLGPNTSCRLLRDMMEQLSQRIADHGGVIVDYAGDGILAMWNAPVPQADHAARACRAGLAMLAELPELNKRWETVVGAPLRLGIGINTGMAQVGNTGSSRKFKYGPHGHAVNLASRVQTATKELDLPLLITASTRALLPESYLVYPVEAKSLAGVAEKVPLFHLDGEIRVTATE